MTPNPTRGFDDHHWRCVCNLPAHLRQNVDRWESSRRADGAAADTDAVADGDQEPEP